jgi:hypothetical protein
MLFVFFIDYAIVHPFAVAINLSADVNEPNPGLPETVIFLLVTPLANPLKISIIAVLESIMFANENVFLMLTKGALDIPLVPLNIFVNVVPAVIFNAGNSSNDIHDANICVKEIPFSVFSNGIDFKL